MSDQTPTEDLRYADVRDVPETPEEDPTNPTTPDPAEEPGEAPETPEEESEQTFTAEYVRKLREESAAHRVKAKRADDYARALFTARVEATGRLADPTDLPYDEALLDDRHALEEAIDRLLADRPHYAARRRPFGDVGQGVGSGGQDVDLAGILRNRA